MISAPWECSCSNHENVSGKSPTPGNVVDQEFQLLDSELLPCSPAKATPPLGGTQPATEIGRDTKADHHGRSWTLLKVWLVDSVVALLNIPEAVWCSRTLSSSLLPLEDETCHVGQWLSQAPWFSTYFLSNKIPSLCLISPWCLLLRGSALRHIVRATNSISGRWECNCLKFHWLPWVQTVLFILHLKVKPEGLNRAQRTCWTPRFFSWLWRLPSVCRIHFIPEKCCLLTPHCVICVQHSRWQELTFIVKPASWITLRETINVSDVIPYRDLKWLCYLYVQLGFSYSFPKITLPGLERNSSLLWWGQVNSKFIQKL